MSAPFVVGQKVRIKSANVNNFYAAVQRRITGRVGEVVSVSEAGRRISLWFGPVGRKQEYRLHCVPYQFLEVA